jgi:hypothetical protein
MIDPRMNITIAERGAPVVNRFGSMFTFIRPERAVSSYSAPARRTWTGTWTMSTRLQSRRLLVCRGNRRFSGYVARQSERLQPRGLFTRGQTGCLIFGHCFLTVSQPLFLLLENRLGSIACLMSIDIQRRYSFSGESTPQDRPSWDRMPWDRMPFADVPMWGWSTEPTPFRLICSAPHLHPHSFALAMQRVQHSALPFQAALYGGGFTPGGCHVIEGHRTGRQPALSGLQR